MAPHCQYVMFLWVSLVGLDKLRLLTRWVPLPPIGAAAWIRMGLVSLARPPNNVGTAPFPHAQCTKVGTITSGPLYLRAEPH